MKCRKMVLPVLLTGLGCQALTVLWTCAATSNETKTAMQKMLFGEDKAPMRFSDVKTRPHVRPPQDASLWEDANLEEGWKVSDGSSRIRIPVETSSVLRIRGMAGEHPNGFRIELVQADGATTAWTVAADKVSQTIGAGAAPVTLSNAFLRLPWGGRHSIRPNPFFYNPKRQEELAAGWEMLPPASRHAFSAELRCDGRQVGFWMDGRYVGSQTLGSDLREIVISLAAGAAIRDTQWQPAKDTGFFVPVDAREYARPGAMRNAALSIAPGFQTLNGVPFNVAEAGNNVDVGVSTILQEQRIIDVPYAMRSAFDGVPETLIFSVPRKPYIYAYLLCAAEETPGKTPSLTVRLTRSRHMPGGRGDAFADTQVTLPSRTDPASLDAVRVGDVVYPSGNGTNRVPLWLARVPLKIGEIQDMLMDTNKGAWPQRDTFDLELTMPRGERNGTPPTTGNFYPMGFPSAVHVFGVTLEAAPIEMVCGSRQVGNVFYRQENPAFQARLTNRTGGKKTCSVAWTFRDMDGKETVGSKRVKLEAAADRVVEIPIPCREHGWYEASIRLMDEDGRLLIEYPTTFALLPPDTRQAGYQSSFGTYWHGAGHYGSRDPAIAGTLLRRAGLRHTVLIAASPGEKEFAPYKVTTVDLIYRHRRYDEPFDQWFDESKKEATLAQGKFPHNDMALILHECGVPGLRFPPELYGEKPVPLTPEQEGLFQTNLWNRAVAMSRFYRETYPNMKLVFGNAGWSGTVCAEFFRHGYPKEYLDYLGVEMMAYQSPETLTEYNTQGTWLLKETARLLGYGDVPVSACHEWICGRPADLMGGKAQADWFMRDILHALVYGFKRISPSTLVDPGSDYYHALWNNGGGLCRRYPLLNPRPSYVAYATLTRELDGATFVRALEDGSSGVYVLEFKGQNGYVYTAWTPRGMRPVSLRFDGATRCAVVDEVGRESRSWLPRKSVTVDAETGPAYVRASRPVKNVKIGISRFPGNVEPAERTVASRMDAIADWTVLEGTDARLERPKGEWMPFRTRGDIVFKEVEDAERGRCLSATLVPGKEISDILTEYAVLRLKEPVAIPGKPRKLGMWVKGNAGWGTVMWEFLDAKGERWLSCGRGEWACEMLGWGGRPDPSVNFEGWAFIGMNLPPEISCLETPTFAMCPEWVNAGGDLRVDYPIKVTGIAVVLRRKMVYLTEMKSVRNPEIRLQGLSACE
ncbi:MAG: hypothetical protein PHR35_02560 [Kiritimatiellae bacterium]|nr:hypothetical protein [Kiritimatiellia bacterium]